VVAANAQIYDFQEAAGTLYCEYCVSEDATADDQDGDGRSGNNQINISIANMDFDDPANGDFHLGADSVLLGDGINLTTDPDGWLSFSDDIDGQTRPGSGGWCPGADERIVVGGDALPMAMNHYRQLRS
jgi:hypothetical protein